VSFLTDDGIQSYYLIKVLIVTDVQQFKGRESNFMFKDKNKW